MTSAQQPSTVASPWSTFPIGSIRARGWMEKHLATDLAGFTGRMPELCEETSTGIFTRGRVPGGHWRHWWNGESEGKWIDGLTRVAHVSKDPRALDRVALYHDEILEFAARDGYIGIYTEEWRNSGGDRSAELWTQSLILLALLSEYEGTRDTRYLDAAVGAARATAITFGGPDNNPFAGDVSDSQLHGHNLMIVEPMLWIYDITADPLLLDFSIGCYERYARGAIRWLEADGTPENLGDPDVPMIGHGAHTAAQLRVPLLLFRATGDPRWKAIYEVGFEKIQKYVSPTGTCKSDECIGTESTEGLPFPESAYEYCTITELSHSLQLAYSITRESKYADRAERIIFNSAQGARLTDGTGIAYVSADNQYDAGPSSGARYKYSPVHSDVAVCCNPSATRTLAHHVSRAILRDDDGLTIGFYGPVELAHQINGVEAQITLDTAYPFDDEIRVRTRVEAPVRFVMRLRIPQWATSVTLSGVDGEWRKNGEHYEIDRWWSGEESFGVVFEAPIAMESAVDGSVFLRRGALVYALDIPAEQQVLRSWPVEGFHDTAFIPHGHPGWHLILAVDADRLDSEVTVERTRDSAQNDPFEHPPISLRALFYDASPLVGQADVAGEPLTHRSLVPFGSTRLRRTTFTAMKPPANAAGV